MKKQTDYKKPEISKEMKELVVARIEALAPSNLRFFIGDSKGMTKEEMISHIESSDEIGKSIVKSHMSFLKAVASGKFMKAINSA